MNSTLVRDTPPCAICLKQNGNPDILTHKCVRCRQVEMCKKCFDRYERSSFRGKCPVCNLKSCPRTNTTWYEISDIEQGALHHDESDRIYITESAYNEFLHKMLRMSLLFIMGCVTAYYVGSTHTDAFMGETSLKVIALRIVLGVLLIALYILIMTCILMISIAMMAFCIRFYNNCPLTDRI